jgi:hypothetical protein
LLNTQMRVSSLSTQTSFPLISTNQPWNPIQHELRKAYSTCIFIYNYKMRNRIAPCKEPKHTTVLFIKTRKEQCRKLAVHPFIITFFLFLMNNISYHQHEKA